MIVVHGAGSIGAFIGGAWLLGGADIVLLGRPWLAEEVAAAGALTLSDYAGRSDRISADSIKIATDSAVLAQAALVVLTVKATALETAIAELTAHCPPTIPILALQNGIGPLEYLRERLPHHHIIGGVVSHNVVHLGDGRFHKATAGETIVERDSALDALAKLSVGGFESLELSDDFAGVRWGKMLINLNNAVNAVSRLGLRAQLTDPHWRRVTAAAIREGLAVARAEGVRPAKAGMVRPQGFARMLSLPDWLFAILGRKLDRIDANARSSMADDVAARRPTEIAWLNGAIVARAERYGIATPVNRHLVSEIRAIEAAGANGKALS